MASQADIDEWLPQAVSFYEYDSPVCDDAKLVKLKETDDAFLATLRADPDFSNPLIALTNYHFHQMEPHDDWKWENTHINVREAILRGLVNRGCLVLRQKNRLFEKIFCIEDYDERQRILDDCNNHLQHTWTLLYACRELDKVIKMLCSNVNDFWSEDPIIEVGVPSSYVSVAKAA